ncbi:FGFR1 oncogene partner [Marchantia polymorpha subsp. ruderalis]|uniref:FGFR1 oncogene partner (FOP) N-terminal dimerisation domain-containing protein n=2 Tax=Marchantia polymorpha TaxID=3197 RepID=A0AAF6B4X5_MARPO|nr:hypothetical protein MARPO_0066s0078 [Marchantia polymorpha]BBN07059.1 hypothetical protein Mp_4g00640 [Marchantia polymorpha subsp. ruderalis]|eukprot:PTQ36124.1 hypothetical protein MARPO_0066s0078 [Marchantia polymorpha]
MDDYMKEMMDLKTLVTKSLEKKGVLARIRAELRANVFQAIEEQDHATEAEGGDSFALLGGCSERAKQLHSTPAGKLLTGLICEYLEWCELERTLRVYSPELNQPRPYSRAELEELLEIKSDKNVSGISSETRPLLLEVLEGYLKSETTLVKDSYAVASSSHPKPSRVSSSASSKPSNNGLDIGDEDLRGGLESRLNLSNKGLDQATSSPNTSLEKHSQSSAQLESCTSGKPVASTVRSFKSAPAPEKVVATRVNETCKDVGKLGGKLSLLGELPPLRRTGGLAALGPVNTSGGNHGSLPSGRDTHENLDVTPSGLPGDSGIRDCWSVGGSMGFSRIEHNWQDVKLSQPSASGVETENHGDCILDQNVHNTMNLKSEGSQDDSDFDFRDSTRKNVSWNDPDSDGGSKMRCPDKFREETWGQEDEEVVANKRSCSSQGTWKPCKASDSTAISLEPTIRVSPAWLDRLSSDTQVKDVMFSKTKGEDSTAAERKKCPSAYFYSDSDDDGSP